ncbi:hypothetical protein OIV83_001446 [Microbotryomycetes sp. JL201]|nr:hypothetical protein OIV83_001446 [Microbotryomycetes sp. JL201]
MGRQAVITIVRHGETDHNVARIIQGHLDTTLNRQGEAQAAVLARYLSSVHFDEMWTSDLKRARKTAEAIHAAQTDAVELKNDERIRERCLGDFEGKRWGDLPESCKSTIESGAKLTERLMSFWDERLSNLPQSTSERPYRILLASHGGAIRHLVEDLLLRRKEAYAVAIPGTEETVTKALSGRIGNCCITEFIVEEVQPRRWFGHMTKYADESHFEKSSRAPSPSQNVDVVD